MMNQAFLAFSKTALPRSRQDLSVRLKLFHFLRCAYATFTVLTVYIFIHSIQGEAHSCNSRIAKSLEKFMERKKGPDPQ